MSINIHSFKHISKDDICGITISIGVLKIIFGGIFNSNIILIIGILITFLGLGIAKLYSPKQIN